MRPSAIQFLSIMLCFFLSSSAHSSNIFVSDTFEADSNICLANAGALIQRGSSTPCISTGPILLSATHGGGIGKNPSGAPNKIYLLTKGDELTIVQMGPLPQFMVDQPGKYRIHTLMYDTSQLDLSKITLGVSPASYIYNQLTQAGGIICGDFDVSGAKFEVTECLCTSTAFAGRLRLPVQEFCNPEFSFNTILIQADFVSSPVIPQGFKMVYVISHENYVVIHGIIDPKSFTENGYFIINAYPGTWRIHSLVYNPADPGWEDILRYNTQMNDVLRHLKQGGGKMCGDLDKGGAIFTVKDCNSKALVGVLGHNSLDQPCFEGSAVPIKAGVITPSVVPSEYILRYVLSEGRKLVVNQIKETPNFSVTKEGLYHIHILIFHPKSLNINSIELGKTTLFEIRDSVFSPSQPLCGSLDMLGDDINIYPCPTPPNCDLSLIEGSKQYQTCLPLGGKARLRSDPPTAVKIPGDCLLRYVLTRGDSLILKDISTTPDFQVSEAGSYRIHILAYNPSTFDFPKIIDGVTPAREIVDQFIPERKGGKICAYWTSGIPFDVLDCVSICQVSAGSLKPAYQTCISNIAAQIRAATVKSPIVPKGFLVRYVLTKGDDLMIEGFSNFADFKVNNIGQYRIHTVVYDPYTLDLSGIIFGRSHLYILINQLNQTGRSVCGALDKDGALFEVKNCDCPPAFSGRVKPLQQVCYDGINPVVITGVTDLPAIVPPNFRQVYIFSSGENMVIEKVIYSEYLSDPRYIEYIQVKSGIWRIHSFVYNPKVQIINDLLYNYRVSRVMDIYPQLVQGGGQYCGSLDVFGAVFNVEDCSCPAKAGTLSGNYPCLNTGATQFRAKVNIPSVVPYGYQSRYVLSQGDSLVVRQIKETPEFNITQPGRYRIHTLVYQISMLNPRNIRPGKTTVRDIHHLIYKQDNFSCGSINLFGEAFADIRTCSQAILVPNSTQILPEMASTLVFPNPTNDRVHLIFHWMEANNQDGILIELMDITGKVIQQIKYDPGTAEGEVDMTVLPAGLYLLRVLRRGYNPELIRINKI